MSFSIGTRLGPYEIAGPLGAGGMGEVYRARDSRLNRDVAIKILPAAFASDAVRMARFQREAQTLAALSHPNIASIYGLEESGGGHALIMELVEGQTLAERIAAGPVPLEEALAIARQIADALEAAHAKGIIHRDLKPANIKITPEGKVKVLDFGLAKALDSEAAGDDRNNSPTLTLETRVGIIMGTAGYMSPEQARGKTVDKRADIWAFGVVLYEMLTGTNTFAGDTVPDTLAAVLRADIEWQRLPAGTPGKVRRLLQRCLERDPHRRLRDIGDAWIEIDGPEEAASAATPQVKPRRSMTWLAWVGAGLLAGAGGAWGLLQPRAALPRPVTRWAMTFPGPAAYIALSRDGASLAYAEAAGSLPRLALRRMDQLDGKAIPGAEDGYAPAFSPDGRWLLYSDTKSKLKKIPVAGGTSIPICDGGTGNGAAWGEDGRIIFSGAHGLMRVWASGGAPQTLTTIDRKAGETAHRYPYLLPGGEALLFTIGTGPNYDTARIAVLDLKNGGYRVLVNGGSNGRFVPTGHLVYVRGGTLFAVPFDSKRLAVTGPETPVVERLSANFGSGGDYAFSASGMLLYMEGGQNIAGKTTLAWADRKGATQPMTPSLQEWGTGRLSPDGTRVANSIHPNQGAGDIWVYEIARGSLTRLTFDGPADHPIWTPDGTRITFGAFLGGKSGLYSVAADGSGKPELIELTTAEAIPTSWTPDGKSLLYTQDGKIWVLTDGRARLLHENRFAEGGAQVSPDGRWVAYSSEESGTAEIYAQPFPGPGAKVRISTGGGATVRWSPDGRELFYWETLPKSRLMAVTLQTARVLRAESPQALFELPSGTTWDVAPDGKRFLVEQLSDPTATYKMEAVTDWFEELRRLAPVRR